MIQTLPPGETGRVLRTAPEPVRMPRFRTLRSVLSWAVPAAAMIAGAWAGGALLLSPAPYARAAAALAAGVAVLGGMHLFERLVGAAGAAVGLGVPLQLIHLPLLDAGLVPGWVAPVGWLATVVTAGLLAWRVHTRRPPVIGTAAPLVVDRTALDALADPGPARDPGPVRISGTFRLTGWPRTALQAVELPGDLPAEIDGVASLETSSGRGTAFVVRDDGTHADLVTNDHMFARSRTARVGIAGTVRRAVPLPRPDPERLAGLLGDVLPGRDPDELRHLARETDLRVVRIDSRGLAVAPLVVSDVTDSDDPVLSVGYPHGGIPRFVWPAHPVPLPVVGIGRLVRRAGTAELWSPWRIEGGNSGGPLLVYEQGGLRVAAVTYVRHAARRSLGDAPHISAVVLRAYLAALDGLR